MPSTSQDSIFASTPLIFKSYLLYRPIASAAQNFKKPWRYGLGEKLQTAILTIVEQTGQALYARQPLKEPHILKIIGTIQTVQLFIRLALDENIINEHQFFAWSDQVEELSRMAGGWLASVRAGSN
ncbi:MAG: four helix bundle protein [Candidatus Magasanikbacteria bacterium]|nr:four helix bundle protein [Candidatus Magasanikbacteria bacterium]